MAFNIDLRELALRESGRVEWKENGDFVNIAQKIVKTISAFANDLSNMGGGYVVCGAKEGKDEFGFAKLHYTGLSTNRLHEIEGKVLSICRAHVSPPIAPIVHILPNPDNDGTKILVFTVLATHEAHSFRDKEGDGTVFYVRIGRETVEAKNGLLTQLLIKKQKITYFDQRINAGATDKDIDFIVLREYLQAMGLFNPDKLLNAQAYTLFDKVSNKPNQIKYPLRALQEAVINAIVHRDYEISEPNRITVFSDRIEIRSVGTLHWGVDKTKFVLGKASPKWRNQCFAYLFNKLQLAQSEGQGIPTIIKTMQAEGCPPPVFDIEPESITCILPAHPRHQLIRDIQQYRE